MRKDHPLSNKAKDFAAKLAPKYSGPYVIKSKISRQVYELELPGSRQLCQAHVRFLKPFVEDNPENSNAVLFVSEMAPAPDPDFNPATDC